RLRKSSRRVWITSGVSRTVLTVCLPQRSRIMHCGRAGKAGWSARIIARPVEQPSLLDEGAVNRQEGHMHTVKLVTTHVLAILAAFDFATQPRMKYHGGGEPGSSNFDGGLKERK